MPKINRLITIDSELNEKIKRKSAEENWNFSDWVETHVKKLVFEEFSLKKEREKLKKRLKRTENALFYLKRDTEKKQEKYAKSLSPLQKKHILETKAVLDEHPEMLKARVRLWNGTFGCRHSDEEYLALLELEGWKIG